MSLECNSCCRRLPWRLRGPHWTQRKRRRPRGPWGGTASSRTPAPGGALLRPQKAHAWQSSHFTPPRQESYCDCIQAAIHLLPPISELVAFPGSHLRMSPLSAEARPTTGSALPCPKEAGTRVCTLSI